MRGYGLSEGENMELARFKRGAKFATIPVVMLGSCVAIIGNYLFDRSPALPDSIEAVHEGIVSDVALLDPGISQELRGDVTFVKGAVYQSEKVWKDANRNIGGQVEELHGNTQIPAPIAGECTVVTSTSDEGFYDVRVALTSDVVGHVTAAVTTHKAHPYEQDRPGKASGTMTVLYDATTVEICNNGSAERTSKSNKPAHQPKEFTHDQNGRVFIQFDR